MTTFRHEPGIFGVLRGLNLSFRMYFCLLKTPWVQMTTRELADLVRLSVDRQSVFSKVSVLEKGSFSPKEHKI